MFGRGRLPGPPPGVRRLPRPTSLHAFRGFRNPPRSPSPPRELLRRAVLGKDPNLSPPALRQWKIERHISDTRIGRTELRNYGIGTRKEKVKWQKKRASHESNRLPNSVIPS